MDQIPEWFCGSRLNFAENLLRYQDDNVALYTSGKVHTVLFIVVYMGYVEMLLDINIPVK